MSMQPAISTDFDALADSSTLIPDTDVENTAPDVAHFVADDGVEQEAASVMEKALSPDLQAWVDRYGQVGERHPYLWNWCVRGVELTTLESTSAEIRATLCDTKVLGVMLDVLLDDVADQGRDPVLLEQLLSIPCAARPLDLDAVDPAWRDYAAFTVDVWAEIERRTNEFPRHREFAPVLRFDYLQLLNTMRYAHLINSDLALLNLVEHDLYSPQNMHMMISATMDLMCSPDFDHKELGLLREAIWHAQYMGRIGNLATTWPRELHEGDYTSGVFAHAVASGRVSIDGLKTGDPDELEAFLHAGGHELYFLERWRRHYREIARIGRRLESVDLRPLLEGLERLIRLHLGSRGRK